MRGEIVAGKYRLNLPLGSGGMAEVWSATNTFTERQVAIKFMSPHLEKTPDAAQRFLKEATVSARVNHPNVIDVLDVGQTDEGQLFLVMELLTGLSLETALRRQNPRMTIYELFLAMTGVARALAAAHKSGVVHRDLKPTNIFLHKVRDGVVIPKLLDFGISKFVEDERNPALTMAGTVLGSPLYMSPEQARGESNLDGRTDMFAFGAILFEALCGYRAYEARNFNALIVAIATSKPKSIDVGAPHLPSSLRRVVRACMDPDRTLRARDFDEILVLLSQAMPELKASPLHLPPPIVAPVVTDPDATNALPVLRASDHAEPVGTLSATPSAYASPTNRAAAAPRPGASDSLARPIVVAAALAVVGAVIGAALATRSHPTSTSAPEIGVRPTASLASSSTLVDARAPDEIPTMSIDALPRAD